MKPLATSSPIAEPPLVSYSRACRELGGISRRHLRRLVQPGRLVRVGRARITLESLNRELDRRKVDIEADIADIPGDSAKQKRTCSIPKETEFGQSENTMLRFPRNDQGIRQIAELVRAQLFYPELGAFKSQYKLNP